MKRYIFKSTQKGRITFLACVLHILFAANTFVMAQDNAAAGKVLSAKFIMPGCNAYLDEKNMKDLIVQGICVGAINAIYVSNPNICSPDESTYVQARHIVISYINQKPKRFHEDFYVLANEALMIKWPCHP